MTRLLVARKLAVSAAIVGLLIFLGSLLVRLSLQFLLAAPEISVTELADALQGPRPPLVIDVREPDEYATGHIPTAVLVPREALDQGALDGEHRPIVVVCQSGVRSAKAVTSLISRGHQDVSHLAGGTVSWQASGRSLASDAGRDQAVTDRALTTAVSRFEQTITIVSGFVVKPIYMALALLLILFLRRAASPGLRRVRLGVALFLAGEVFCAINYLAFGGSDFLLEVLHGLGMVLMGMLVPWGFAEIFDSRALCVVDPASRCTLQRFCQHCWKRDNAPCGMHRIYTLMAASLAILALIPWTQPLAQHEVSLQVFGTRVCFAYPLELQLIDFRLFPVLAALCLTVAFVLLSRGPQFMRHAHPWFFVGIGFMSFSLLRFFLLESTRRGVVWADFLEEATELAAMLAVGILLWTYRRQLGIAPLRKDSDSAAEPGAHQCEGTGDVR